MSTTNKYAYIGFRCPSLEDVVRIVQDALGISMHPRDSDYKGHYYAARTVDGGRLTIESNDPAEDTYGQYGISFVLYISEAASNDELVLKVLADVSNPVLLRTVQVIND